MSSLVLSAGLATPFRGMHCERPPPQLQRMVPWCFILRRSGDDMFLFRYYHYCLANVARHHPSFGQSDYCSWQVWLVELSGIPFAVHNIYDDAWEIHTKKSFYSLYEVLWTSLP